jgi:GT2 family glycosyltransferase/glycosyltransferase involved in cell wall biosynthesis
LHRFWITVLRPVLTAVSAKTIVEVGAASGQLTDKLLEFARENDGVIHVVEPVPDFDVTAWEEIHGPRLVVHRARSLNVLSRLPDLDVALIDGDHNWWTVYNELQLLSRQAAGDEALAPVIALHDVGWPYGRRDVYYDPRSVPDAYRQPYAKKGMVPGQGELVEGGLNPDFCNAIYEHDLRNGVLTAVEDFVLESSVDWVYTHVSGFHGLGVLATKETLASNPELENRFQNFRSNDFLEERSTDLEQARVLAEVRHQRTARDAVSASSKVRELEEARLRDEDAIATLQGAAEQAGEEREASAGRITALEQELEAVRAAAEEAEAARVDLDRRLKQSAEQAGALLAERDQLSDAIATLQGAAEQAGEEREASAGRITDLTKSLGERDRRARRVREMLEERDALVARLKRHAEETEKVYARLARERTVLLAEVRRAADSRSWRFGHKLFQIAGVFLFRRHMNSTSALDNLIDLLERPVGGALPLSLKADEPLELGRESATRAEQRADGATGAHGEDAPTARAVPPVEQSALPSEGAISPLSEQLSRDRLYVDDGSSTWWARRKNRERLSQGESPIDENSRSLGPGKGASRPGAEGATQNGGETPPLPGVRAGRARQGFMRIGFIEPHLGAVGGIRRILETGNRLVKRGHSVSIYLPDTQSLECTWMPCLPTIRPMSESTNATLDVVIFNHEPQWYLLERFARVQLRVFLALSYSKAYEKSGSWESLRSPVDLRLANSRWTADRIEEETGQRPLVVPTGIDLRQFRPVDTDVTYPVLCVGDRRPWKGTPVIEEACRLLGLPLEKIAGKDLPQECLAEEYCKGDVFVVGSPVEGFGFPGLEALACGRPLVTTDNGGCREYAVHDETAIIVPPGDAEAMAAAITRLRVDPDFRRRLGEQGRAMVERRFSWDNAASGLERALTDALEGHVPLLSARAAANGRLRASEPMPKMSVIILSWNTLELLQRCIESARQNTDVPYELIVIDNGSDRDDSAAYVAAAADHPLINKENRGFSAGFNQGLEVAKGKYVLFLNSDTKLPPRWASRLISTLDGNPSFGIVFPAVTAAGNPLTVRSEPRDTIEVLAPFKEPPSGVALAMKTDVVRDLGGWGEEYEVASGEDTDLCFKVWVNGLKTVVDEGVLIDHVAKASARQLPEQKKRWAINRQVFLAKWTGHLHDLPRIRSCPVEVFESNKDVARGVAFWMQRYFEHRDRAILGPEATRGDGTSPERLAAGHAERV